MTTLWFFMLQRYVPPAGEQSAAWVDTATRYVELRPPRNSREVDPVAEYCVRHMRKRMVNGEPRYRVKVREYQGRIFCHLFVVHIDGTRTSVSD